jgi:hypothetical protein
VKRLKRLTSVFGVGIVFGVCAGLLGLSGEAANAAPTSPSLIPAGYYLVYSGQYTAPGYTQTHGWATCPGQKQPASGGVVNESAGFASAINSSYPSGHSWEVDFNNQTSTSSGFVVYAVCLAQNSTYTVVENSDLTAIDGTQSEGFASCPLHTKVTGGGALSESGSTAVDIHDSFPSANGWMVDINNRSGVGSMYTVFAVCHPKPTNYSIQGSGFVVNPGGTLANTSAACPGGQDNVAIGGGAYTTSSDPAVQLYGSFPNGSGGWTSYEQNLSQSANLLDTYAICAGI